MVFRRYVFRKWLMTQWIPTTTWLHWYMFTNSLQNLKYRISLLIKCVENVTIKEYRKIFLMKKWQISHNIFTSLFKKTHEIWVVCGVCNLVGLTPKMGTLAVLCYTLVSILEPVTPRFGHSSWSTQSWQQTNTSELIDISCHYIIIESSNNLTIFGIWLVLWGMPTNWGHSN